MINIFKWEYIETIQYDLVFDLIPLLLNMVVFNHNHNHIYIAEEFIEIRKDFLLSFLFLKIWIIALERMSEMSLLDIKKLKG